MTFASLILIGLLAGCRASPSSVATNAESGDQAPLRPEQTSVLPFATAEPMKIPPAMAGKITEYTATRVDLGLDEMNNPVGGFFISAVGTSGAPTIVSFHSTTGLSQGFLQMQLRLVGQGFNVFVIDIYGYLPKDETEGEIYEGFQKSARLSTLQAKLVLAMDYLSSRIGAKSIGLMGWSTGGKWVTKLALVPDGDFVAKRKGARARQFSAVVNLYGDPTDLLDNKGLLVTPYLGIFSLQDDAIPTSRISEVTTALSELNYVTITKWSGVPPHFMEPYRGEYNSLEADKAYQKVTDFFHANLR